MTCAAQATDCSTKSAGSKMASAMPSLNACGPVSVRLLLSGFSIITLTAFSGPISRGRMYTPPQPGMSPMKASGRARAPAPVETVR